MFAFVEPLRSRAVSRLALLAALAAGLASCSNDTSRFGENPWANKPQSSNSGNAGSNEVTGSIPQAHSAPSHRVESSALPPPGPSASAAPSYGGGSGIGAYQPPARPEVTGSVQPRQPAPQIAPREPAQAWSWDGGTPIVVAQGETLDMISRRHGVAPSAILQANNMTSAAQLRPGQRLVIPRVQHQMSAAPQVSAPATRVPVLFRRPHRRHRCTQPPRSPLPVRTSSRPARRSSRSRATIISRRWRSPGPTMSASIIM
jgi:hypothetical protein